MSKDNQQSQNPYEAYGYNPQSYGQYGFYMDPRQFGYTYPTQQQQGGFQMPQTPTFAQTGGIAQNVPGMLPLEESYIENILRLNKGKAATVYMGFDNTNQQKVFKGLIEAAGRDHLILSDPQTGMRYLLLMVFLQYITFDEEIEYQYPFGGGAQQGLVSYPPR
ncbi:spore coat protein GerQ [Fredinandcohnia sp. QZ13]|uniref:spore coat protein GerQ n=1 Tax=Fredinandcohnia sp. QZ13 TaxID=3073144 RepID=UPI00285370FE|nr:spore coat protein GerQ [Fredinandcohnia sp. QZ13]MDR4890293.1 spore coat protein GerQ [Fredinandcohnia sp. QZ13]